jgi:hypothetical protein
MQGARPAPYVLCDPGKWHVEDGLFGAEHEPRVIFWPCGQLDASLLAVAAIAMTLHWLFQPLLIRLVCNIDTLKDNSRLQNIWNI